MGRAGSGAGRCLNGAMVCADEAGGSMQQNGWLEAADCRPAASCVQAGGGSAVSLSPKKTQVEHAAPPKKCVMDCF